MASFFSIGEKKNRSGVYLRYENYGNPPPAGADDGKCAAVFRSNWGPVGQVVVLEQNEAVTQKYGSDKNGTAAVATEQFKGGAQLVYGVRLGSGGTPGIYIIEDTQDEAVIQLTLKYPGSRKLSVTIRPTLADTNVSELLIIEGTEQLEQLTFDNTENSVESLLTAFQAQDSEYFILTKTKDSTILWYFRGILNIKEKV